MKAEIFEELTRSFFIASVLIHEEIELTINGIKLKGYRMTEKKLTSDYTDSQLFE